MLKNKWIIVFMVLSLASWAEAKIKVVTTFSDFATIAEAVGENVVEVGHLSHGDQDPHFVPPKPSLAIKLKKADMLVSTGQDLEMWLTTLQDKARNKNIMDGAIGFVTILIGLKKVDPKNSDIYEANQQAFVDRVHRSMFGDALVDLIGGEQLVDLQRAGTLFDFLENEYEGELLKNKLGGWLKQAMPFRGLDMVAYHKNWAYFAKEFGLNIVGFIESKPGIPPTPKHVEQTIQLIKDRGISVMLVASYFERRKPATIAQKTGIQALFLPLSVGAVENTEDNFKLMDFWINEVNQAIGQ